MNGFQMNQIKNTRLSAASSASYACRVLLAPPIPSQAHATQFEKQSRHIFMDCLWDFREARIRPIKII